MTWLTLRLLPLLAAITALPVLVMLALPAPDSGLLEEVLRSPGCPAPCWLGIRPGSTDLDAATDVLEDHDWVETLVFHQGEAADSGFLEVTWNSA